MDIPRDEEEFGNVPNWTNMSIWGQPYDEWDEFWIEEMQRFLDKEYEAAAKIQRAWRKKSSSIVG